MTVSTTSARDVKLGNGSTRTFSVSFEFFQADDLDVTLVKADGTLVSWTLNQQYTVSGGGGSTGSITTTQNNTVQSGQKLIIERTTPLVQPVDLVPNDFLPAETLEDVADILTLQVQEINDVVSRAIRLSPALTGLTDAQLTVPADADIQNSVLIFDGGNLKTAPFQQAGVLSWNGLVGNVSVTTDGLPEGTSNLYYTDERAQDAAWTIASGGGGVGVFYDDAGASVNIFAQVGDGITIDGSNQLAVDFGVGLEIVGNQLAVDLDSSGGLAFNGSDAIQVVPGNGLTLSSGTVAANLGNGLEFNSGLIQADLGNGLEFNGSDIQADLGNGLEFNGSSIQIGPPVARTDQNNVFASGVNGGQQTIKGGFPNLFLFEDDNTNQNVRLEVRNSGTYAVNSVEDDGSTNRTSRWTTNLGTGTHNAWGGRIQVVGDPSNEQDAVNLRTSDRRSGVGTRVLITHSSSGTLTLDLSQGRFFDVTLQADVTDVNVTNAEQADSFIVRFDQDGTGNRDVTWGSDFEWPHGTALQVSDAANATDIFQAITFTGGTTWFTQAVGLDFR